MRISFAVTAKLICVFVFAYADCWFSHEAAQRLVTHRSDTSRPGHLGAEMMEKTHFLKWSLELLFIVLCQTFISSCLLRVEAILLEYK